MPEQRVRQALVLGIGAWGTRVAARLQRELERRYGGIPSIAVLRLGTPEEIATAAALWPVTPEPVDAAGNPTTPPSAVAWTVRPPDKDPPWLPPGAATWLRQPEALPRSAGRLALESVLHPAHASGGPRRAYSTLHAIIEGWIDVALRPGVRNQLQDKGMVEDHANEFDIYLVASLGEPVASGSILDLAYLINHRVRHRQGFYALGGVLHLPALGGTADPDAALCYASLKEIDHAMTKPAYRWQVSPALTVEADAHDVPFNAGCFLVSSPNERNESPSDTDLEMVVADWLMGMLALPLRGAFSRRGALAAGSASYAGKPMVYGSFGSASLVVPINELVEHLSARYAADLLREGPLASAAPGAPREVATLLANQELTLAGLETELQRPNPDWNPRTAQYRVRVSDFRDIPVKAHDALERKLITEITLRATDLLPLLAAGMQTNATQRRDQAQQAIQQHTAALLNTPTGGIARAEGFLTALEQQLDTLHDQHQREHERVQREQQAALTASAALQQAYWHWSALRPPPWLPLGYLLVAVGLSLWYWSQALVSPLVGSLPAAAVLIVIHIGVVAAMPAFLFYQAYQSRLQYLSNRLKPVELQLRSARLSLTLATLEELRQYVQQEQATLQELRTAVEHLQDRIADRRGALAQEAPLFGSLGTEVEVSALTAEDLDWLYTTLTDQPAPDRVSALYTAVGPVATWQDRAPEVLYRQVEDFARTQAAAIRPHAVISAILERRGDAWVRQRAGRLWNLAQPFWQYHDLRLEPGRVPERVTVTLLPEDLDPTGSGRIFSGHPGTHMEINPDPHRIGTASVRHGLPLFVINVVERLKGSYTAQRQAGETARLHVTRSHMVTPDLVPGEAASEMVEPLAESTLSGAQIAALALACGIVAVGGDGQYSYQGRPLAASACEFGLLLQEEPGTARALSADLAACLTAQGLAETITLLEQTLQNTDLEAWQEDALREYLTTLRG